VEAREGGPPREDSGVAHSIAPDAVADTGTDEGESDEDESEDQPGVVRGDQGPGGERRPRRRGRRGGRRRRGGPEDGLVGSISDELGPTSAPEATSAVADFDGVAPEPSLPEIQPESIAPHSEPQPAEHAQPEPVHVSAAHEETAQEAERAARRSPEEGHKSLLSSVKAGQPALSRAMELQRKASSVGFDWNDPRAVLHKIREEADEIESALDRGDARELADETGDLLFALVNLARHVGADPELALRGTNAKFERRFGYIERTLATQERSLESASLEEMDALWNEAKAKE